MQSESVAEPPKVQSNSLASDIGTVSGIIASKHFSNGDRATLKRMNLEKEPPLTFYRFVFRHLEKRWQQNPTAWQAILSGMAIMHPNIHDPGHAFGKALAKYHYSEIRLERLLAAKETTKITLVLRAVRFLAAKNTPVSWIDIAKLLLVNDAEKRERINMQIARDYYSELSHKE